MPKIMKVDVRALRSQLKHVDLCCMVSDSASRHGPKPGRKRAGRAADLMDGLANMLSEVLSALREDGRVVLEK